MAKNTKATTKTPTYEILTTRGGRLLFESNIALVELEDGLIRVYEAGETEDELGGLLAVIPRQDLVHVYRSDLVRLECK